MKEYIVPIEDSEKDFDEMFVGYIRNGAVLIRCKDCKHFETCSWSEHEDEGFCKWGERKEDKK